MTLCECGCGQETTIYRGESKRFIHGHNTRKYPHTKIEPRLCECGCGKYAKSGNRFINHHHLTGKERGPYSDAARANIRMVSLQEKEPLPDGWKSKLSDITNNKKSSTYLGNVAEIILSNIYEDVRVMPYGNHGYDVICNRDFRIDIKASSTGDKLGYWSFHIEKNQIADYFLCIAFNNRDDLYNPVHLWMIPGHKINHLITLSISKSTVDKWQQYELSLDKLLMCCDNLKR